MAKKKPKRTRVAKTDPSWRRFEKTIQAIFSKHPSAKLTSDAVVRGRSGRNRKLELLVDYPFVLPFAEGFAANVPIRIAVDCKDYGGTVGIKKVEEFHGQMDDIGAPVGILISTKGFDSGAKARAPQLNIFLIHATWDLLSLAKGLGQPPEVFECVECRDARSDRETLSGYVNWEFCDEPHGVLWGTCDWCNSRHAICPDCGVITGFCEVDYRKWIECNGGCGRLYRTAPMDHEGSILRETISGLQSDLLVKVNEKGRISKAGIRQAISASKWQFNIDGSYSPVQELDELGLAILTADGLIANASTSEFVDNELPKARSSMHGY